MSAVSRLTSAIDNSPLVVFRLVFGFLITVEAFGAIATGWVRTTLVEPDFTFSFIWFEWLQPLPGSGMYYYFALMGILGIMVTVGHRYRLAIIGYTLMWAGVYFMQKSAYNNHYYLMLLLCFLMCLVPAHRWFSLDVLRKPALKTPSMPRWCLLVFVLQVWIVYTYAAVAKMYPDWLDATVPRLFMSGKAKYPLIGGFLQQEWVHYAIAYTGVFFDLLIVPLLLWKRTRMFGFVCSIFFHLFNSVVFQIGIFPYMSIAFALFFFSPETIRRKFLPKKPPFEGGIGGIKKPLIAFFSFYFIIQLALPLRHWSFEDNVLWTEEGHRLSWRMMLRTKSGAARIKVVDKDSCEEFKHTVMDLNSRKQRRGLSSKPDFMWQYAQRLKKQYAAEGRDVAVYFDSKVSVNGRPYRQLTDPEVDLAAEKWSHFRHHSWLLPFDDGKE